MDPAPAYLLTSHMPEDGFFEIRFDALLYIPLLYSYSQIRYSKEMSDNALIQMNEDGELESLNLDTGVLTPMESSLETSLQLAPGPGAYRLAKDTSGRLIYVPPNTTAAQLREISGSHYQLPYSRLMALQICERISNGSLLKDICAGPGMPSYGQVGRWRREHQEFNEWMKLAKQDSAHYYFDAAIQEVENADPDKDEISLAKLKSEMYKYAAKVSSPDEYGDKKKVELEATVTTFVVETGIRRVGDQGYSKNEIIDIESEIEGNN